MRFALKSDRMAMTKYSLITDSNLSVNINQFNIRTLSTP